MIPTRNPETDQAQQDERRSVNPSPASAETDRAERLSAEEKRIEMAQIIEEAETPQGSRIVTVTTARGDEMLIDLDRAACAVADLLSDLDNERRQGWTLNVEWYDEALARLRNRVAPLAPTQDPETDQAQQDERRSAER